MKHASIGVLMGVTLLLASISGWAHHSFQAEYDQNRPLKLVGKLTSVRIENPHGWLYMDARNDAGRVVNWALETPGPAQLAENGYNRSIYQTLVMTGEEVTVTMVGVFVAVVLSIVPAYAARDGSKHAWAGGLTRADGQTVITLSGIPGQGPGGRGGRGGQ